MNDTTYRDPRVLGLLAEHFVAIRVDADARPDLAERYAEWAWPATALLTPTARPITELRGHQPAGRFVALLADLAADRAAGRPLGRRRIARAAPDPALADLEALRALVAAQLDGMYDPNEGGWGTPQKYPFAAPVEHALFRARVHGDDAARGRALSTLEGHESLIDPVWGGIYQYSVGGTWDDPHFEKITALQAGAIQNFATAYRITSDHRWLAAATRIYVYMRERMSAPGGGFFTSEDADIRIPDEDDPHGAVAIMDGHRFYALDDRGRRRIGAPRIDQHVYSDLNGMMIRALVELYEATFDQEVLDLARDAAARLLRTHRVDGGFTHGPTADDAGAANAEARLFHLGDQVEMIRGLLALHEATAEARYLEEAEATLRFLRRTLGDGDAGGFFAHSRDPAAVGVFAERHRPLIHNAIAARVLLRLGRLRHDPALVALAADTLRAIARPAFVARHGRKVGELLLALEEVAGGYALLSVVGPDEPATRALHRAALQYANPLRLVELARPDRSRYPYPGQAAIYLCTADACSMPVTDPATIPGLADDFIGGRN